MGSLDYGGAAGGAVSGAATGSAFGVPGAVVGGTIGAITGLFSGKRRRRRKKSTLDPQQQQLYNEYVSSLRGEGPMADLYNWNAEGANENFDKNVSRPAYRNFNENIVPTITGQYRGSNIMNSSYSGEALSRAGRNVQESLDAQRSNMQFNGQQNALEARRNAIPGVLNMTTQRDNANNPSTFDQIANAVGPHAAEYVADYLKPKTNNSGPIQGPSQSSMR